MYMYGIKIFWQGSHKIYNHIRCYTRFWPTLLIFTFYFTLLAVGFTLLAVDLIFSAGCGSCGSRVRKVRRKKVRVKRKPGINDGCPDDESPSQRYDVRSHETQQGRRKGQRGVDKGAGEENISVSGELGHITI